MQLLSQEKKMLEGLDSGRMCGIILNATGRSHCCLTSGTPCKREVVKSDLARGSLVNDESLSRDRGQTHHVENVRPARGGT